MRTVKQRWKTLAFAAIVAAGLGCSADAEAAAKLQNAIGVKTNTGNFFPVVRVSMMVVPDGGDTFEIVLKDGQGEAGVKSISFEKQQVEIDYTLYNEKKEEQPSVDYSKPFYVFTNTGKFWKMKDAQPVLTVQEGTSLMTVTAGSDVEKNVSEIRFFRGTEEELNNAKATLIIQQQALDEAKAKLEEQQLALATQAARIDDLIGIRTTMIRELSASLSAANMKATVDPNTGDIVLDSSVFFETGKAAIKEEGQELLNRFIPVYLDVLLRDKYADYLGEIIIEGHTDSSGSYESNLKLSQDRALQVALYCLNMPSLSYAQKTKLQEIMTATGRSESDPVYVNGVEDKSASRRVEFKFSLKDSEMIEEMNRILSNGE